MLKNQQKNQKDYQRNNYLTQRDAGIVYLFAFLSPSLIGTLIISIFVSFFPSEDIAKQSIWYLIISALIAQICFALIYIIYVNVKKINVKEQIRFNKLGIKNILLIILCAIILVLGLNYFIGLFDVLFEKLGVDLSKYQLSLPNNTFGQFALNIFLVALIPAICEELIFRGLIYNGLKTYNKTLAIIISSLMFALMHLSPVQFIYPIIMGIIFVLFYEKTNSLLGTMLLHFCNNFIIILIEYLSKAFNFSLEIENNAVNIIFIILGAIISILCVLLIINKLIKATSKEKSIEEKIEELEIEKNNQNINKAQISVSTKMDRLLLGSLIVAGIMWLLTLVI